MPTLAFSNEVVADVKFLTKLPADALKDFCKAALNNLKSGVTEKKAFAKAAQSLNVSLEIVLKSIESLSQIFLECAKISLSDKDFRLSVTDVGFEGEQLDLVAEVFTSSVQDLRRYLQDLSVRLPHYHDLAWRVDVEVGSRTLRGQFHPTCMLQLSTTTGTSPAGERTSGKQVKTLQADFSVLKKLQDELGKAVKQMKTPHANRTIRYIG